MLALLHICKATVYEVSRVFTKSKVRVSSIILLGFSRIACKREGSVWTGLFPNGRIRQAECSAEGRNLWLLVCPMWAKLLALLLPVITDISGEISQIQSDTWRRPPSSHHSTLGQPLYSESRLCAKPTMTKNDNVQ